MNDAEAKGKPVEMRDVVTEATRKRGPACLKGFTVLIVICILCSQLFVVWKIQEKYRKGAAKEKKEGASVVASGHSWDSAASFHKSIRKV